MAKLNWDKDRKFVRMRKQGQDRVSHTAWTFSGSAEEAGKGSRGGAKTRYRPSSQIATSRVSGVQRRTVLETKKQKLASVERSRIVGDGARAVAAEATVAKRPKEKSQRLPVSTAKKNKPVRAHSKHCLRELQKLRDPVYRAEVMARQAYRSRSRIPPTVAVRKGGQETIVRRGGETFAGANPAQLEFDGSKSSVDPSPLSWPLSSVRQAATKPAPRPPEKRNKWPKHDLTKSERKHLHLALIKRLEPIVKRYAKNGTRKPRQVAARVEFRGLQDRRWREMDAEADIRSSGPDFFRNRSRNVAMILGLRTGLTARRAAPICASNFGSCPL
jgi:hypothetical protein